MPALTPVLRVCCRLSSNFLRVCHTDFHLKKIYPEEAHSHYKEICSTVFLALLFEIAGKRDGIDLIGLPEKALPYYLCGADGGGVKGRWWMVDERREEELGLVCEKKKIVWFPGLVVVVVC